MSDGAWLMSDGAWLMSDGAWHGRMEPGMDVWSLAWTYMALGVIGWALAIPLYWLGTTPPLLPRVHRLPATPYMHQPATRYRGLLNG